MRTKGSPEALEMRRKDAAKLLDEGFGVREVARLLDVSPSAVSTWKQAYETDGAAGLAAKPQTGGGRPPFLSYDQYPRLERLLLEGPRAHGFETELWTLARVGVVIEREFGVSYSNSGVRKILKRMGWSYQKPQSFTQKRDDKAVARLARDRAMAKEHIFLSLCLRLVVAITNYERGGDPSSPNLAL